MSALLNGGSMSNTTPPVYFDITTTTTDQAPNSNHKAPEDSILIVMGVDKHGYLSAHRNTAKLSGRPKKLCTVKSAKYDPTTKEVVPRVSTYWI